MSKFAMRLMPAVLRRNKGLDAMVSAMVAFLNNELERAYGIAARGLLEAKSWVQVQAMEQVLNQKFDALYRRITIHEGDSGNVLMFGKQMPSVVICGRDEYRKFIMPQGDIGCDFFVTVPMCMEAKKSSIEAVLRRYVFAGIVFKIKFKED